MARRWRLPAGEGMADLNYIADEMVMMMLMVMMAVVMAMAETVTPI